MFKHFFSVNFNTRTATQTRSKYTRLKYIKKGMFKHLTCVFTPSLGSSTSVKVDSTKMFKLSFFYIF
jgi:hypothetical protein